MGEAGGGGWIPTSEELPENGLVVDTIIDDAKGARNHTALKRQDRLWFTPDGEMYTYYRPTHWRALLEEGEE